MKIVHEVQKYRNISARRSSSELVYWCTTALRLHGLQDSWARGGKVCLLPSSSLLPSPVSPFFSPPLPFPLALSTLPFLLCCETDPLNTTRVWRLCCNAPPVGSGAEPQPQSQCRYILSQWNVSCGNDFGSFLCEPNVVIEVNLGRLVGLLFLGEGKCHIHGCVGAHV